MTALILLAALAGAPTSAYTQLDLNNCEVYSVAHAGEEGPPEYVHQRTISPEEAPDKPTIVEIGLGGELLCVAEDDLCERGYRAATRKS
mgnify:CR=1 FL=1